MFTFDLVRRRTAGSPARQRFFGPAVLAALLLSGGGCYRIPDSLRGLAAELPGRADGQYAPLDDELKRQLVTKDALLQCRIDREDGAEEADSAACRCSMTVSEPWTQGCKDWLGSHVPAPAVVR